MDLCESFATELLGGSRYLMVIVDNNSKKVMACFLKHRLVNQYLYSYLQRHGIVHEKKKRKFFSHWLKMALLNK